jgi:hypothetical protein
MAAPPVQSALAKLPLAAKIGIGAALSAVVMFAYWFIFYSDVSSKIVGAEQQPCKASSPRSSRPRGPTSPIGASWRSASSAPAS